MQTKSLLIMKTKIAFNDIPNVIKRDEMRQILGGNVSSVYKEDSTVVSGRTDLLSGGTMGTWYSSVGDKGFMGYGSSYKITDPNQIKQIMAMLSGTFGKLPAGQLSTPIPGTTDTFLGEKLREVVVGNNSSATQTLGAVAFGWDLKTMLSQLAVGENAVGMEAQYIKYLENVGVVGLVVSGALTGYDVIKNGSIEDYHIADLGTQALIYGAATTVPVAGWALGAAYFLGNYYCEKTYGEGMYEHLSGK